MKVSPCAGEGNRTHTPHGTRSKVWLVYHFQHARASMSPKGIANLVQIIRFAKSIYPTMYLLFGRKARSLAATAHTR